MHQVTWRKTLAAGLAIGAGLALAAAAPAWGQVDGRVDPATGREIAVFPPARHFDFDRLVLELDIPTMEEPKLRGVATYTARAVGMDRGVMRLNAKGPVVSSVTVDGAAAEFSQDKGVLEIRMPRAVSAGAAVQVRIAYDVDFGGNRGEGLTWSKGNPGASSQTERVPQIHSQGQPEDNSRWFPGHDFPNDRLSTELIVTVDEAFEVLSNGRLADVRTSEGRKRWHWVQERPHPMYLVCLFIAQCTVLELGGPESARPGLSMPLYVPEGKEESAKVIYADSARMMAFFEQWFDEPYPWDKYAQALVRDFAAGGMENTSATFNHVMSAEGRPGQWEDLIAHELAHQWLGDLITCNSWEHLWLNEGWASYGEALWTEHEGASGENGSAERARRNYQRTMLGFVRRQRSGSQIFAPGAAPMISNRYADPNETFMRGENVYSKGAVLLHMLRKKLGDEVFQRAVQVYIDRHKDATVETDDFRRALEDVSGVSLERFFWQWAQRPGVPRLEVELSWDEESKTLQVKMAQKQTIDRHNPAFAMRVPLRVSFGTEEGAPEPRFVHVDIDTREASASFVLPAKPAQVSVDPDLTVFAINRVSKPLAMWMDELEHPASLFALEQAVEQLAFVNDAEAGEALMRVAMDEQMEPMIRERAASSAVLRQARIASAQVIAFARAALERSGARLTLDSR